MGPTYGKTRKTRGWMHPGAFFIACYEIITVKTKSNHVLIVLYFKILFLIKLITSRTSSASMLMKGSETCKAHMLSIIGEITGSMDNADSCPSIKKKTSIRKMRNKN